MDKEIDEMSLEELCKLQRKIGFAIEKKLNESDEFLDKFG